MTRNDRVRVVVADGQPPTCFAGMTGTVVTVDHEGSVLVQLDGQPVPFPFAAVDLEPRALSVVREYGPGMWAAR